MTHKEHISGTQLFCLLVAGRLSHCLLLPADSLHALTVPDLLAVTVLNAAILLLLMLPTAVILRKRTRPLLNGRASIAVYGIVLLFVLYLDILQFTDFARQTVRSDLSVTLMTVALVVTGLTAALYGIQALGRTALIASVTGIVLLLLFCVLLIPQMRAVYIPPAVFSGWPTVVRQTLKELPRTAEIVAVGALYPYVNGRPMRAYGWFVGATAVLTFLVCTVTSAVLGDYAGMTAYPFYSAVSAATVGVAGSPELPIIALWLSTFFVRMALFGWLWLEQAGRLFGGRARLPAAGVAAVVLIAVTVLVQREMFAGQWLTVTVLYAAALIWVSLVLPLVRRRV